MIRLLVPCLFLFALASLPASARDSASANSTSEGGSCPDGSDEAAPEPRPAGKPSPAARAEKAGAPTVRSGGENAIRPPRWHSFLPGMFR